MKNSIAKEKASNRRKPDKTVDDFLAEAEETEVDNDAGWVDFEQQQLYAQRKELSLKMFWNGQSIRTLSAFYKSVFPGIATVEKNTKKAHLAVIRAFLDEEGSTAHIDIQAASGVENASEGSDAWKRKDAIRTLFSNSGKMEFDEHYLDYSKNND